MIKTGTLEIEHRGRKVPYQLPLGIILDGKITGRIHDFILPKYQEMNPERLVILNEDTIRIVNSDAKRQLTEIAQQDTTEAKQVRQALRNTINLTTQLLQDYQSPTTL